MEMAEVENNWCDICGPSFQHKERCFVCGECLMHFCVKCYDIHLNSCKYVVTQKYHECVLHHCLVSGFCFTCNELTCVLCDCIKYKKKAIHKNQNLCDAFFTINRELDGSIQELDLRGKQIESTIELQKISVSCFKECLQCKRPIEEYVSDACSNNEHFFGRLRYLKSRLVQVKENLEYIKGEKNPILFLAKWENPNTIISLIDEVLPMKQYDFAIDSKLPSKNGSAVDRNLCEPTNNSDDIGEELASRIKRMNINDEKPEGHNSVPSNANCIISEMLEISGRLPNLVKTLRETPLALRRCEELPAESQHDCVNTIIEHVRETHNYIIELYNGLIDSSELKAKTGLKREATENTAELQAIIMEMLRLTKCLPVIVKSVKEFPSHKRRFLELPEDSKHECLNNLIGYVLEAYNCIIQLNNELIQVTSELKFRTEMMTNQASERANEQLEYDRKIQEYKEQLQKDTQDGKGMLRKLLCRKEKTKNHDESYSLNKRQTTLEEDKMEFQKSIEELSVMIAERESTIEKMRKEKNDLESRLSALAGEQLTKGNPALTDLGDPNRPMKIGEKYGELYDNEWTETMDLIGEVKTRFPDDVKEHDDIIVYHLYRVLTECYKECKKESGLQLEVFGFKTKEILEPTDENKEGENISDPYTFNESSFHRKRKQNAESFAKFLLKEKRLCKNITESWDYRWKSEDLVSKLLDTPFFQRCVYLCWSMVVQDPMMHLDDELPKDSVYDRNLYKEFIQKGDKVKFVVWPALFLHKGGPMLYKGVVQAYSTDDSTTTDSTKKKEHFV